MKPLDPRLLRYARGARIVLGVGGCIGVLRTLAVIAWCWAVAQLLALLVLPVLDGMGGAAGRVAEGAYQASALPGLLALALGALLLRSGSGWAMDALAARGAVRVKSELRSAALDSIDAGSPEALHRRSDSAGAMALGRGLDALDGYFSSYLPQLILTASATPLLVLAVLLADPLSGVIVLIVFPVIPVFMILIGMATRGVQQRQWGQLQQLSGSYLDVVEGLTTLKIFRREGRQVERIARETGEYRRRTMEVLRVTFLSGFVLDLAGTFSIALVAVTVGTRLVAGEFPLALGLFVLLLLPEAFIPIRAVGSAFHASTEGLAAAEDVFEIIETQAKQAYSVSSVASGDAIKFTALSVVRGPRTVGPISFDVQPGEMVALVGPSGSGKSTLVATVLGFVAPASGQLERPERLAWVGQRPGLLQGSIAFNVSLGDEDPDLGLVRRALASVGLGDLRTEQALGPQGSGLSGGQAQRVAIARALYRTWRTDAEALVCDEPSSALDAESEARVAAALRAEAQAGRAVLLISHRPALIASADRTVELGVTA